MTRTIDPLVEGHTRTMLGHAIRGEMDDLATLIHAVGDAMYKQVIGLCVSAAEYITIDVCERWPTDADLHEIARRVATKETAYELDEADVYNYLSKAALNYEPLEEALGHIEKAASLPVLITASLLFRFRPQGQDQWNYLDQIWKAILEAESLEAPVVPAVQNRAHREQILKARSTE